MESAETKQSTGVVDMRKKPDERGADKEHEGYFIKDRFVCFIFLVCCLFCVGGPNEVLDSIVHLTNMIFLFFSLLVRVDSSTPTMHSQEQSIPARYLKSSASADGCPVHFVSNIYLLAFAG